MTFDKKIVEVCDCHTIVQTAIHKLSLVFLLHIHSLTGSIPLTTDSRHHGNRFSSILEGLELITQLTEQGQWVLDLIFFLHLLVVS